MNVVKINLSSVNSNNNYYKNTINNYSMDRTSFTADPNAKFVKDILINVNRIVNPTLGIPIKAINRKMKLLCAIDKSDIPHLVDKFSSQFISRAKTGSIYENEISSDIDSLFPQLSILVKKNDNLPSDGLTRHMPYTPIMRVASGNNLPFPYKNEIQYQSHDLAEALDTLVHELTHVLKSNSLSNDNPCVTLFLANGEGININKLINIWRPFEKSMKNGDLELRNIDNFLNNMDINTTKEKDWAYKYLVDHAEDEFQAYSLGREAKLKIFSEMPNSKNKNNDYNIHNILDCYSRIYKFITDEKELRCRNDVDNYISKGINSFWNYL